MFDRTEKLIGEENLNLIKSKTILLVGLGGVGGSCFETLVRSGIENIIVIDFDKIDITNLNRQVIAYNTNISKYKVDVCMELAKKINSDCNIKTYKIFLDETNIKDIITNDMDYIIDACDSIKAKEELIKISNEKNIKMISCMGTGNKLDPTMLEITDIYKTQNDPLARIIRKWCRDNKINKLKVVSSKEIPIIKDKKIASMSFVPNTAGILLANYVIRDIINKQFFTNQ